MTSCSAPRTQCRAGETEMAEKLFKWVDQGLLSEIPAWNRRNAHADPVQCGKYRPDFVFEGDIGVVIDEYDENGHYYYKLRCELIRQLEISAGYGDRPVHWIRYNPDPFFADGHTNPDKQTRDTVHLQQLQHAQQNPDYEYIIKIDYLFYRPMFGGDGGAVQSFKFHKRIDYENWVDSVAPESGDQLAVAKIATNVNPCRRFLLSYESGGTVLNHTMFSGDLRLAVDECYTLIQTDLTYTLIHSHQRASKSTLFSVMSTLGQKYGIKGTSVFEHDAVSSGEEIDYHPAFKLMIESMNAQNSSFEYWMAEGTLQTNKKGLLFKHLSSVSTKESTRAQLINQIETLEKQIEESKKRNAELELQELECQQLRAENKRLKIRCRTHEILFVKSGRADELLPPSP